MGTMSRGYGGEIYRAASAVIAGPVGFFLWQNENSWVLHGSRAENG